RATQVAQSSHHAPRDGCVTRSVTPTLGRAAKDYHRRQVIMQLTEDLIRGVVAEVLAGMRVNGKAGGAVGAVTAPPPQAPSHRGWGVFSTVDDAVTAATQAQKAFAGRKLD